MSRRTDDPGIVALRDALGLTIGEAYTLALLAKGGIVSLEKIRDVYCDTPETPEIEGRQAIKRIRKKIRTRGDEWKIYSHYGLGYELAVPGIIAVRHIMAGET